MEPAADLAAELTWLADGDEYLAAVSELLMRLLPSDHVLYAMLDACTPSARVLSYPEYDIGGLSEAFLSVWDDHPLVLSFMGDGAHGVWGPRRLSDLVTDCALRRTRTYDLLLRPYEANRQLALMTANPGPGVGRAWGMNRLDVDYSYRELDLAQHIQPVLRLLESVHTGDDRTRVASRAGEQYSLTAREFEVLQLLGKGLTAVAVGHLLGISPRTVAKHLERAYAKLGCTNRIDALRLLRGEGDGSG